VQPGLRQQTGGVLDGEYKIKELNWARWSLLSGSLFAVLWLVSTALIGQNEYLPPAEFVSEYFSDKFGRISFAGYLGAVSTFFLLWFSGSLRSVFR
jgi:hypothetical protein